MFASPYLLVAISIDRYVAICKPLWALQWKYRLVHSLAGTAWAASLLFSMPNIFAFRYDVVENTRVMACMFQMDELFEKAWIGIFSLIVWLAPSIIVGVLYTFVCLTVWKSMRRVGGKRVGSASNLQQREDTSVGTEAGGGTNGARRGSCGAEHDYVTSTNAVTMRKTFTPTINSYKVKTVKLTMTIVVANFVLWAPFCITNAISTYFRDIQIDVMVTTCIMLVGNANSCVNPWIYVIFNYKRVWETLCGGDQRQNSSSQNRAMVAAINRASTPTTRLNSTTENNSHTPPYENSSHLNWSPDQNRPRTQNSHRRSSQRRSNNNVTTKTRRLSQTSMISSYSAF